MKISSFKILTVFFLFALLGFVSIFKLSMQLNPSYSLPSITVSYNWYGASAASVEAEVTSVFEGSLSTLKGIENLSSSSSAEEGYIVISIKDNVSIDVMRQEISSIIKSIFPKLPENISYPQLYVHGEKEETHPLLIYSISSESSNERVLRTLNTGLVKKLNLIPEVSKCTINGITPKWIHIRIHNSNMKRLGINKVDIGEAIRSFSLYKSIGRVKKEAKGEYTYLAMESSADSIVNWQHLPVKKVNEKIIYLGDIANIKIEEQPKYNYYRMDGMDVLSLLVYPTAGCNQLRLAKKVKEELVKQDDQLKSKGITLTLQSDTTEYIHDEIVKIFLRLLLTLVILFVLIYVVSLDLKYLAAIFISLMVNLLISFFIYALLKIDIHVFSIAGLTISLGLLIDNVIVMVDHIRIKGNRSVFLAVFSATLTTIASLMIIYFLPLKVKLTLIDFALVVIVNLSVSLLVALFFIPALLDKMKFYQVGIRRGIFNKKKSIKYRLYQKMRFVVHFSYVYSILISFLHGRRWIIVIVLILSFGIPIFLLPSNIENETQAARIYNTTVGSSFYQIYVKEFLDKWTGGSLQLFVNKVNHGEIYESNKQTTLHIVAEMPPNASISQLNEVFVKMEQYLSQFEEIDQYRTDVYNSDWGEIVVSFKNEIEHTRFPNNFKKRVIKKALEIGSADWDVFGVGEGFSNSLLEETGRYKIKLSGYDYSLLMNYADSLRDELLMNSHINKVNIMSKNRMFRNNSYEYYLEVSPEKIFMKNNHVNYLYNDVKEKTLNNERVQSVVFSGRSMPIGMSSRSIKYDLWELNNDLLNGSSRIKEIGKIEKRSSVNEIIKNNQSYQLFLEYDYIGNSTMAKIEYEEIIDKYKARLPLGFKCVSLNKAFSKMEKMGQVWLLFLICGVIFIICSILLESLIQPLIVIIMIPITLIGVFLVFYVFNLTFDQGGYAGIILLCGLTVNSTLYIINEYNSLKNNIFETKEISDLRIYIKAFNSKISPILLTILSTVLGLIPFFVGGKSVKFWFPMAASITGGLIFSFIGVVLVLPLFLLGKKGLKAKELEKKIV